MLPLARNPEARKNVLKTLQDLDNGIVQHTNWLKTLHRGLLCEDAPPDPTDLAPDAHFRCRFGRWYYQEADPGLREEAEFIEIGELHRRMHDSARHLLNKEEGKKGITAEEFDRFMDRAIGFKHAVRQLQYRLMNEVCAVDCLTGAWNRHALYFKLDQEYQRILREGGTSAVCMMDIDHFKEINDTHGHTVGDAVLRELTEFIADNLRKYDSIFRYGGEEFLLCLPGTTTDEAGAIVDRLRQTLGGRDIEPEVGTPSVSVTVSFGLSLLRDGKALAESITEADHALMYAKENGRNQVCLWGHQGPASYRP